MGIDDEHRVLLLGDGNFSFSLALCHLLADSRGENVAHAYLGTDSLRRFNVTASSFDSRDELHTKYPESCEILREIEETPRFSTLLGARVLHCVNAWELHSAFPEACVVADNDPIFTIDHVPTDSTAQQAVAKNPRQFDTVIWNHPHLGTEDFRLHRFLMAHFFCSVSQVLHLGGEVCLTLVQGQELRWSVVVEARRCGFRLDEVAVFDEGLFPGYTVKRNTYGGSFKAIHVRKRFGPDSMKSHLLRFVKVSNSRNTTTDAVIPAPHPAGEIPRDMTIDHFLGFSNEGVEFDYSLLGQSIKLAKDYESHYLRGVRRSNNVDLVDVVISDLFVIPEDTKMIASDDSSIVDVSTTLEKLKITAASNPKTRARATNSENGSNKKSSGPANVRKLNRARVIPADLICPHCGKQLSSDRAWTQHVHMVHVLKKFGDRLDKATTDSNGSSTSESESLASNNFKCDTCGKFLPDNEALYQHTIAKHSKVTKDELAAMVIDIDSLPKTTVTGLVNCEGDGEKENVTSNGHVDDGMLNTNTSYIPCPICLQAILGGEYGMKLHLETLKPSIGLYMQCPICKNKREADAKNNTEILRDGPLTTLELKKYPGLKGFYESRSLLQHFKFCRERNGMIPN